MAYPTDIINGTDTDLTTFTVKVDGEALDPVYGVMGITVNKAFNKIPSATLIIADGDASEQKFEASASDLFKPGNEVEVQMGYDNTNEPVFKGIIIKHSIQLSSNRPTVLVIELKDEAVKLTVGRKNKCFYEKTDKDIISEIIGTYSGVTMGKADVAVPVTHEEMVQYYCTDWDFIVTRAEANGNLVYVEDGEISLVNPSSVDMPLLNLTYGINVYEFAAEMDARDEYTEVVAKTWDDAKREVTEKSATKAALIAEEGNIPATELADVIGLDKFQLQHQGRITESEIDAWAKSKLMRSRLSKIKGHVKIEGFGKIKPGDVININKFSPRFNNHAFVSAVTHQLSAESAWYTEIQFGFSQEWFTTRYRDVTDEPASGLLPAVHGLMLGIVMDIDQTDTDLRVKVNLPLVNKGGEGIWARFAGQYLGQKRGIFFRPEVDDEVVLGFLNDDPREPVILGSLNSANSKGEPPVEVTKENDVKGIYTRSGIKIEINDEDQTILIETPEKNKIEIKDKEAPSILLEDQNGNKIEMSDEGITIESASKMTLKAADEFSIEAPVIKQTADSEITIESSGTLSVESSTILTLKGSTMVDINP